MALEKAEIIDQWVTVSDSQQPSILVNYDCAYAYRGRDETLDVGSFFGSYECETAVMDAIEADPNYTIVPGTRSVIQ